MQSHGFFTEFFSSFRTRLLTVVTMGILCLAVTAALTTAWVTSNQAKSQMIAQGLQVTGNLASQSALALLFASRENAEEPLQAMMGFPNIEFAGLFDTKGVPLVIVGAKNGSLPDLEIFREHSAPTLINETPFSWHFVAPVYAGSDPVSIELEDSPFQIHPEKKELLGFVYVSMNKRSLHKLNINILASNIIIGLSFAGLLLFVLNIGIKRLTHPLYELSTLMTQGEKEGDYVYADLKGPKEITHMAGVFNRMMATLEERDKRLRQHQEILQTEVAIRTKELVHARDAALTASRHKSEFLANMTHELRTPLQAIIGYADVVKEELEFEGKEEGVEDLERVIHNAQRLLSLINNILGLAKVEAGKMELRLQSFNLRQLANEASETVQPMLRRNNNDLQVSLHGPEIVDADREKLLHAMLNLLTNAAKFTKDGQIFLEVDHGQEMLTIQVADTGIGLTPEQQEIIFEEFRQVDGSATRQFEGTGLGLAITRRFCELMGGNIRVESELGRGAKFIIRIPLPIRPIIEEAEGAIVERIGSVEESAHGDNDNLSLGSNPSVGSLDQASG